MTETSTRTTGRRRRPGQFSQWMLTYLFHRKLEKEESTAKDAVKGSLKSYVQEHGEVRLDADGNEITGNIEYHLPKPVDAGGKLYYGMELRKSASITFDHEAALKLADSKNWKKSRYGHTEFVIEQDAFYVANQKGDLTDDELDSLLVEGEPQYSLWPIEKERLDDDA
jgi:hypothetical protein